MQIKTIMKHTWVMSNTHSQNTWWLKLGVESPSSPYNIFRKLYWELNNVVIYMFTLGLGW
jgi:hypothetical protein